MLTLTVFLAAAPAAAQDAAAELATVDAAVGERRWDDALAALERAYLADPDPYYLYRRVLVLEQMGEYELGLQVLRENRDALLASDRVNDLAVVEERLEAAHAAPPRSNALPIALTAGGAALAVTGGVLLAVAQSKFARLHCLYDPTPCGAPIPRAEFDSRVAGARTTRIVGAVLLPLGAVGIAAGVMTFGPRERVTLRVGSHVELAIAW